MSAATLVSTVPAVPATASLAELQAFVEHEAELLDDGKFEEWLSLYAEDGVYWVPAKPGQESPTTHVSLYYDDKPTLRIRVARLRHAKLHCQDPPSRTVRLVSGFRRGSLPADATLHAVEAKFIMLEDRPGAAKRLFGGRYRYLLRAAGAGFEIVSKRVELTDCDRSFPALTQPF